MKKEEIREILKYNPIIKDQLGNILDGNHRYRMAKAIGIPEEDIPYITKYIDYSVPDARRRFIYGLNTQVQPWKLKDWFAFARIRWQGGNKLFAIKVMLIGIKKVLFRGRL